MELGPFGGVASSESRWLGLLVFSAVWLLLLFNIKLLVLVFVEQVGKSRSEDEWAAAAVLELCCEGEKS